MQRQHSLPTVWGYRPALAPTHRTKPRLLSEKQGRPGPNRGFRGCLLVVSAPFSFFFFLSFCPFHCLFSISAVFFLLLFLYYFSFLLMEVTNCNLVLYYFSLLAVDHPGLAGPPKTDIGPTLTAEHPKPMTEPPKMQKKLSRRHSLGEPMRD